MDIEMEAMEFHQVWKLVSRPEGRKVVGVRWVYKVKVKEDGTIERFKARLTAKGFSQKEGEDYDEIYAPTGKATTSRAFLATAAVRNWHVHQMDVNNAFLYGTLKEEVYMEQPEGYDDGSGRVCKLLRSIYGLKQAPRCWYEEIERCLAEGGFSMSDADHALFFRTSNGTLVVLLVYVDDLLIACTSISEVMKVKELLKGRYKMKDLGEVSMFLGMHVRRNMTDGWLELGQQRYVSGWRDKFCKVLSGLNKGWSTPIDENEAKVLRKGLGLKKKGQERVATLEMREAGHQVDSTLYQSIVGTIMFAATTTRPDLAFSASVLAQFNSDPRERHLDAALRTLQYGISTSHMVIRYERNKGLGVEGFTDSDFAGEGEARSRGAYVFMLCGGAVSWRSKKQETVARSSTEAEYMALSDGAQEAMWLRRLLVSIGWEMNTIPLHVDNESAIALARNPVQHSRTKHIDVHWHFIRQAIDREVVLLRSVRSNDQLADFLTKAVNGTRLWKSMEDVGLVEMIESKGGS
jgi:hypothetical protein